MTGLASLIKVNTHVTVLIKQTFADHFIVDYYRCLKLIKEIKAIQGIVIIPNVYQPLSNERISTLINISV